MSTKAIGYDEELTRLAIVAYKNYVEVTDSRTFADVPQPEWQNLSLKEQEAWKRVILSLSKEFQYI